MMTSKNLDQLLKENIISQRTYNKVVLSKQYIERKYNLKSKKNLELKNFFTELNLYNINQSKLNIIKKELLENQKTKSRKSREKQSIREYESLSIIGRGAFGFPFFSSFSSFFSSFISSFSSGFSSGFSSVSFLTSSSFVVSSFSPSFLYGINSISSTS